MLNAGEKVENINFMKIILKFIVFCVKITVQIHSS